MTSDEPLPVHSLAEAHLYVMIHRCTACAGGAYQAEQANAVDAALELSAHCTQCNASQTFHFELIEGRWPTAAEAAVQRINGSPEPSRIIDVAQWVTLFRVILDRASKEANREAARRLGYEAAQCLEEALKFYDPQHDEPPIDAFFSDETRRRFEQHPDQFVKERLVGLRHKLPTLKVMERTLDEAAGTKWWQFWKRRR